MKRNLFIAFEGIDGSGKSTQVKILTERLQKEGIKVYTTFEPTDNPIGSIIRSVFTHKIEADHRTIAGLFIADRLHHLLNKTDGILKKLEEGYAVITDRYYFSSYAYHSVHMDLNWVIEANSLSAGLLRPDLNIYIDVNPETSMERLSTGRSLMELYETSENLQNVRNKYLEVIDLLKDQEKVLIIDGNHSQEAVSASIWDGVSSLFEVPANS